MGAREDTTPLITRHRLTVDDYYRMAEVGVLAPDARVELIEGEVIDVAPMKSRHAGVLSRLLRRVQRAVGDAALVTCQTPVRLSGHTEPEPDLAVLRSRADDYTAAHPMPPDVLLLIEVADSTARFDREIKAPLYARHGIAELWIVDVEANCVRFLRHSDGERYTDVTASETPGRVALPGLDGLAVDLGGILS